MKFHGDPETLHAAVTERGLGGEWTEAGNKRCFRAKTGEVLNWWPSTGTLQLQGTNAATFEAALSAALQSPLPVAKSSSPTAKIFVVHGHDRDARDQLELILLRLGLQPFILQNSDGDGATIIEALEQFIYRESGFGIILRTPDDHGYSKDLADADRKPRARQNVILEMGMVMAALGRSRMAILQKGPLRGHQTPTVSCASNSTITCVRSFPSWCSVFRALGSISPQR